MQRQLSYLSPHSKLPSVAYFWHYENVKPTDCKTIHDLIHLYLADRCNFLLSAGILTQRHSSHHSCGTAPDSHRTFPVTSNGCSPLD